MFSLGEATELAACRFKFVLRMQYQFNERIKAASSTVRPPYFCKGSAFMSEKAEIDGSSHGSPGHPPGDCDYGGMSSKLPTHQHMNGTDHNL